MLTPSKVTGKEHISDVQSHLLQSTREEKVEAASSINEYSDEPEAGHHWIQHEREFSRL
jgi:hypothetical protein